MRIGGIFARVTCMDPTLAFTWSFRTLKQGFGHKLAIIGVDECLESNSLFYTGYLTAFANSLGDNFGPKSHGIHTAKWFYTLSVMVTSKSSLVFSYRTRLHWNIRAWENCGILGSISVRSLEFLSQGFWWLTVFIPSGSLLIKSGNLVFQKTLLTLLKRTEPSMNFNTI